MTSNNKTQMLVLIIILVSVVAIEAQNPSSDDDGYAWEGSNTNVSPSMAITVIVLVLGFFITGCIFIYIQHRSSTIATTTTSGITANSAIRGLDQSLIDTLPEFQYSAVKELKLGKGALECAVCLSEFQDEETLRFLPKCDHVFHSECIDTWLAGHHTCPVCRDDLAVIPTADKPLPASVHEPALPISTNEVQITIPAEDETARIQNKKGIRLPRSHSTGHSLIQPGENCERFTLRLPADVRRQLLARAKLRATSLLVLPRQTSSRRGYRGGDGEGSGNSRYSRFFGRSFIMRMGSFRTTAKVGMDGDLTAAPSVVKPTDRTLPV